ncbi:hypothetical protein EJ05DRAFT_511423 [Pseudovirgaria hyperparasitica]|uniref:rRNA methyltransferase 1, mitochondrial n=1 Tax=Pseudovirgaria hyperparasitica TaxID=470096 RepID=A0A6A6W449_9PEZI|nr:uncharacterized protein EJ05DRAFT_511423 [Pseudovirgaria hyperparasitica]KAF2757642.1 hypothetical protein EJ05DRAFT_511423 [Pseudovirgaria hyperparasitica]
MLARASPSPHLACSAYRFCTASRERPASTYTAIHRALRQDDEGRRDRYPKPDYGARGTYRERRTDDTSRSRTANDYSDGNRYQRAPRPTAHKPEGIRRSERSTYHHQRPRDNDSWSLPDRTKFPTAKTIETGYVAPEDRQHSRPLPPWVRIPYTTAASQFLYGHSAVLAALKSGRRKIYRLYLRVKPEDRGEEHEALTRWAAMRGARIENCGFEYDSIMYKLSGGRPHNGIILETSPLPVLPISHLGPVSLKDEHFDVVPAPQTKEEQDVNGTETRYVYQSNGWRYPFLLYLDGIADEGNFGAILRSAYLLGVDGIIMNARRSAPLSAITGKASSGALEAVRLFKVDNPEALIQRSRQESGWNCFAAAMVADVHQGFPRITFEPKRGPDTPLQDGPTILMLGNEETGLSKHMIRMAQNRVSITTAAPIDRVNIELDSFNVSVASALLCMNFMQNRAKEEENRLF